MTTPLPDAAPANWVDRAAPAPLRPWLRLARFDRPTGIWLLMLPAWQGIALAAAATGAWPNPGLLALFALGAVVMRSAGCAINDVVDRDLDARVARTAHRPVASGRISVIAALTFAGACAAAGLAILVSLNSLAFLLGAASVLLVVAYPFMKRLTWWPQAWLGLTFNWGVLMGFAAAQGGPSAGTVAAVFAQAARTGTDLAVANSPLPPCAWLLYGAGVFWTLGYDTIYAVQDLADDVRAGVKSTARRLGEAAPRAVLGFYGVSAALALAAAISGGLGLGFVPLWALAVVLLARQALRLNLADPAGALVLFRQNTLVGSLLFAAIVAGHWSLAVR